MKVDNLVKFNFWNVICDNNGSSYSYLNNITESVMYIDRETKKNILGLKMCLKQSKASSYCRIVVQNKKNTNLSKTSGLKLNYKTNSLCPVRIYIKQVGQNDSDPLFYKDIPAQEDWTNIIIEKEGFIAPQESSMKELDWKNISGFHIEPQTMNSKECDIFIKEFIIVDYEFTFYHALPVCLNYKSLFNKLLHNLKLVVDAALYLAIRTLSIRFKKNEISIYGNSEQKQKLWDDEYSCGKWDYLLDKENANNTTETDFLLRKYLTNANALDLGCGQGAHIHLIEKYNCRNYLGLDISSCAIEKAKELYEYNNTLQFNVTDIFSFTPAEEYDFILMSEILYYFDDRKVKEIIGKYCKYLTEDGVICVRIWSIEWYKSLVDMIAAEFTVVDYIHFDSKHGDIETKGVMLLLRV